MELRSRRWPEKKEKELPKKGDEEDEGVLAKKKTISGHQDNQKNREVLAKKKPRNGHQDSEESKEVLVKKKSLVMTFAARKRWKLAKNMFIALRRNKEEVGAMAGLYIRDYHGGKSA